uniref:Secreted protein n=1 Tax=Panagrellus redivivus TaxID=6233 RepID=A0A7E4W1W3_PANRE
MFGLSYFGCVVCLTSVWSGAAGGRTPPHGRRRSRLAGGSIRTTTTIMLSTSSCPTSSSDMGSRMLKWVALAIVELFRARAFIGHGECRNLDDSATGVKRAMRSP